MKTSPHYLSKLGLIILTCLVAIYGSSNIGGAMQFWRVKDWTTVGILAKPNAVHDIAFSPQPGIVAYTQYSGGVTVSFIRFLQ